MKSFIAVIGLIIIIRIIILIIVIIIIRILIIHNCQVITKAGESRQPQSWVPVNIFSSFLSLKILFIDFSDNKQTRLRRKMKTNKKSLVPLFTFPPPLLAALFLLADCHYKALQGDGGSHKGRAQSEVTKPHVSNTHSPTHTHTHTVGSLLYVCSKQTQTHTHTHITTNS